MRIIPLAVAGLCGLAMLAPSPAGADDIVDRVDTTTVSAAGELTAWWGARAPGGRRVLTYRLRDGAPVRSGVRRAVDTLDVGLDGRGRPTVVWSDARGRVEGWRPGAGPPRRLVTLPQRGATPALWGSRIAFVGRARSGRRRCAAAFLLDLRTKRATRAARPDCEGVDQLDLNARWLAIRSLGSRRAESVARVVRLRDGRARVVQAEDGASLEQIGDVGDARARSSLDAYRILDEIGAIALDGDRLYTARLGLGGRNTLTRHDLRTGRETEARLPTIGLEGALATSQGRFAYTVSNRYTRSRFGGGPVTGTYLVTGADPFGEAQSGLPNLTVDTAPQFADGPVRIQGRLASPFFRNVNRFVREVGVRDKTVEARVGGAATAAAQGRTDADGRFGFSVAPGSGAALTLTMGVAGEPFAFAYPPKRATYEIPLLSRIVLSAERRPNGRVRFSGTVDPPLPGRRVAIRPAEPPNAAAVASGALTPDGGRFDLEAPSSTPAGRYVAATTERKAGERDALSGPASAP